MTKKLSPVERLKSFARSNRCFKFILAFFVLEAGWIALTGRYPMAFDEDFHLGVIRLYTHHISPFWSGQPAGGDAFGAVARDPSYLYHWLMSFPYRFLTLFTDNQTTIVLWLRALNIALFSSGLVVYRRLLLKINPSPAVANISLLLFVLIPVFPLLAAQINYDNLLLPLTGLVLLKSIDFSDKLQRPSGKLGTDALLITLLGLTATLVKYAFLPILLAVGVFLLMRIIQTKHGWSRLAKSLAQVPRRQLIAALAVIVVLLGMNFERYGLNMIRYHTPVPACDKVLSVQHCSAYGPWNRDYNFKLIKQGPAPNNPLVYTGGWFHDMWLRLFFSVDGPTSGFQTRKPLPIPGHGAVVLFTVGIGYLLIARRRMLEGTNRAGLAMVTLMGGVYILILWVDEYLAYVRTGQPVAINGRYLLIILPILIFVFGLAVQQVLQKQPRIQLALAGVAVLTLVWGGGALTYILRSNDAWYWPAQPVYDANHAVQKVLGPITPGYR